MPVGDDLYRLMRLDRIPREDVMHVFTELGGDPAQLTNN
jgi:hypothetical protein